MNIKMILLVGFVFILLAAMARAEIIHLKDGTKVEGKIISDEPARIKVEVGGFPYTYYRDQIERIEGGKYGVRLEDVQAKDLRPLDIIPLRKKDLIIRLMEASGTRQNLTGTMSQLLANVPAENKGVYEELLNVDEILQSLIPVYDKYYSEEELRELVNFYSSAAGKKMIQVTPLLLKEVMETSIKHFQQKMPQSAPTP